VDSRGDFGVMHGSPASSFGNAVNRMWKLCIQQEKLEGRGFFSGDYAKIGTDFPHEGQEPKAVTIGRLPKFSTSPPRLLLLLVL
jgi:hypothetical protein